MSDSWSTDVVASDKEDLPDTQQTAPPNPSRFEQLALLPNPPTQQQLTPSHPVLHESLSTGKISEVAGSSGISSEFSSAFVLSLVEREKIADNILDKYRTIPPASAPSSFFNGLHSLRANEPLAGSSKAEVFLLVESEERVCF